MHASNADWGRNVNFGANATKNGVPSPKPPGHMPASKSALIPIGLYSDPVFRQGHVTDLDHGRAMGYTCRPHQNTIKLDVLSRIAFCDVENLKHMFWKLQFGLQIDHVNEVKPLRRGPLRDRQAGLTAKPVAYLVTSLSLHN